MDAESAVQPVETGVTRLPFVFAKRHGVILTAREDGQPIILTRPGAAPIAIAEANRLVSGRAALTPIEAGDFDEALSQAYQNNSAEAMQMVEGIGDEMDLASLADSVPETEDLMEQEDDAPIIRLINAILTEAVKSGASDIHIETYEKRLVVRFRVDGVLREVVQPKRALAPLLVSRIKVMARLDIAEKRVPQDGRISLRVGGREVDIRVSTMPSSNGERIVLRLLDKQAGRLELDSLGMAKRDLHLLKELIHRPYGIILVTGPTGSGKTTTLYGALTEINDRTRNILTVEDPIEYNLPGIGQTQVNPKVEMTFARGLRAILRQDPDVVMIGEIRDLETAEIAVQASLTGHLVLSTLHTNTAVGAITRLIDMGIEPFLISSSLVGIAAQRLVRVLCESCKEPYTATAEHCRFMQQDPENPPTIYRPTGCEHCNNLGYRGRMGIYEVISVDENLRTLIHKQAGEMDLEKAARTRGPSIHGDGVAKILEGTTTVEEVLRVTHRD
ncbi:type II secretion system ATPase GspE [Hydrocarboniclastica marina]|uniref:Type II secretion system protein E n=1 Tax=Hydrocarboniclastica marina TaxID=2259620 RepID=A0A4P7XGF6_9ALTE|nr:type II secretion system ATPase GspE [Hydrocarboniclastica marina]MAL99337.1 type II secretion system protein GspE [Alteromonadaceae bacterium]QCF26079.1 type II secretion system protein GspE [Hydrocarboniclastica marina]